MKSASNQVCQKASKVIHYGDYLLSWAAKSSVSQPFLSYDVARTSPPGGAHRGNPRGTLLQRSTNPEPINLTLPEVTKGNNAAYAFRGVVRS